MTTAKNEVFVGLKLEKFYLEGGGGVYWGRFFQVGGENEQIFGWWGASPSPFSRKNLKCVPEKMLPRK